MNRYTIPCTEEQTKKALELGAPLYRLYGTGFSDYSDYIDMLIISDTETYAIPTAEEMVGWLEKQKIFVYIEPCFDISCSWHIASKGYNKYGYVSDTKVCKTRKEATLAAIDAALEYLLNNKK